MGKASRGKRQRSEQQTRIDAEIAARLASMPRVVRVRASSEMGTARSSDMALLAALSDARRRLEMVQAEIDGLVHHAIDDGISYGLIGDALGKSRQAIRQRYGDSSA